MLEKQQVLPCLNAVNLNPELETFQNSAEWDGPSEPVAAYRDLISQNILDKEINQIVSLNYGFGGTNSAMSISRDL